MVAAVWLGDENSGCAFPIHPKQQLVGEQAEEVGTSGAITPEPVELLVFTSHFPLSMPDLVGPLVRPVSEQS